MCNHMVNSECTINATKRNFPLCCCKCLTFFLSASFYITDATDIDCLIKLCIRQHVTKIGNMVQLIFNMKITSFVSFLKKLSRRILMSFEAAIITTKKYLLWSNKKGNVHILMVQFCHLLFYFCLTASVWLTGWPQWFGFIITTLPIYSSSHSASGPGQPLRLFLSCFMTNLRDSVYLGLNVALLLALFDPACVVCFELL